MTKSEDLIEYMLLEYLGSLDFISSRLTKIGTRSGLQVLGVHIIPEAILGFGYKTPLRYEKISSPVWVSISSEAIFKIETDNLFGDKVTFFIKFFVSRIIPNY